MEININKYCELKLYSITDIIIIMIAIVGHFFPHWPCSEDNLRAALPQQRHGGHRGTNLGDRGTSAGQTVHTRNSAIH